jgi:hypothetical protein
MCFGVVENIPNNFNNDFRHSFRRPTVWTPDPSPPNFFSLGRDEKSVYSNKSHTIDDLKMTITEYIQNVNRAILNTVFESTDRRINKCLETGGGQFEHYL